MTAVAGVEAIVEQRVNHRTWGRIRRLKVELTDAGVLVRGETSTHYLKQLALLGAREAIGLASSSNVELDIRVGDLPTFLNTRGNEARNIFA